MPPKKIVWVFVGLRKGKDDLSDDAQWLAIMILLLMIMEKWSQFLYRNKAFFLYHM
jgi:hypothetical protein